MFLVAAVLFGICSFMLSLYFTNALFEKKIIDTRLMVLKTPPQKYLYNKKLSRKSFAELFSATFKSLILCLILGAGFYTALLTLGSPTVLSLFAAVLFFIIALRVSNLLEKKRMQQIMGRELPGTLDLIVVCLEAGLGINAAILRVAHELKGTVLGGEFKHISNEIAAGIPLEDALRHFAKRTQIPETGSIVTAIVQSQKMGSELVETFKVQSQILREKTRFSLKEQIMKTPVKILFPLVFFVFPTLFIVILAPAFITIMKQLHQT